MQHRRFNFNLIYLSFYILLLTALLTVCGGSCNSTNLAPILDAGSEQTVDEQGSVTFSGSASDSDGSIVSYQCLQTSGTAVTLENAKTIDAAFIAPSVTADETLIFSLSVTDDDGDIASDVVNINVTNSVDTNTPPIANAGTDQSVLVGVRVSLSGEQSSDADGDSLSYLWSIVEIANGSAISLSDESSISPSFEVDIVGTYTLQLVVDDGTDSSEIDSVQVSVVEQTV
jgi:chitinase